ncbi:MAG: 3-phosphoshikimate 1-carboxyvinyltransferase [Campylobacter sp.]|nr:3-phosphoshikimate 1-carboxyvinyltransferase [Campylobacter sp.]
MRIFAQKSPLNAEISNIGSDKSISHRSAIFALLSDSTSKISNFLLAEDTLNKLKIVEALGAEVKRVGALVEITPKGAIKEPNMPLECGNSGTTIRLFMGLLSSVKGFFVLSGDKYLNERPMRRIGGPLSKVGAKIYGRDNANKAPIAIEGNKLEYFEFDSKISSAQVKTAMILAALNSNGCKFSEPELSRDHSEKMLKAMGADISTNGLELRVEPLRAPLKPLEIFVPNDPSSAFYYAVAASIIPGSHIVLKNMLLNKTRIEAYEILKKMGAKISYKKTDEIYEEIGDIEISYAPLRAVDISENIPWMIDEAPALAVAFACAQGKSILKNAKELRVKECDRIAVMVEGLKACGVKASELEDGFEIIGGGEMSPAIITPHGDHRIAMSFAILGLKCGMMIEDAKCIATSFPNFSEILKQIGASVED